MIVIIDHETSLSDPDQSVFENQLSSEIRFYLTPEGNILDSNLNGETMISGGEKTFMELFSGQNVQDASQFLRQIAASEGPVSTLIRGRFNGMNTNILFKGLLKDGKIYLIGYNSELIARLAAGFVHELRNPLTIIKGFVQMSSITKEFDKYYDVILSEIDRMHSILENFLSLTSKKIKAEPILPDKLAAQFIALISTECSLKQVYFDYDVAYSARKCLVDMDKIKQVMINFLRNAMEALAEKAGTGGKIILRGTVEDACYRFSLSDNGSGVEKEVLKHLGEPFYTTKSNGTGIGLSLCKKIISAHHGTFCLSSVAGRGTTVSFTLPFKK